VIVLDLNVPTMNGQEVMAEMAGDPELNTIPVAVVTPSTSEANICDAYPEGRCVYFTKTVGFKEMQGIVRQIAAFARKARGE
jgi:CheY-like chemotaxis protein